MRTIYFSEQYMNDLMKLIDEILLKYRKNLKYQNIIQIYNI